MPYYRNNNCSTYLLIMFSLKVFKFKMLLWETKIFTIRFRNASSKEMSFMILTQIIWLLGETSWFEILFLKKLHFYRIKEELSCLSKWKLDIWFSKKETTHHIYTDTYRETDKINRQWGPIESVSDVRQPSLISNVNWFLFYLLSYSRYTGSTYMLFY